LQVEVAGLQTIEGLQARALRRADAVDALDRRLYAAKGRRRTLEREGRGFWASLWRRTFPDRLAAEIEKLERDRARSEAALKIAVDELHQAHCQRLRAGPSSPSLLRPTEAGLRAANAEYHPWDLVQMSGKRALSALYKIDAVGDSDSVALVIVLLLLAAGGSRFSSSGLAERIEAMNQAGDALKGFANALRFLAREHPETGADSGSPSLTATAERLSAVRTRFGAMAVTGQIDAAKRRIAAIMTSAERDSGAERNEVGKAQERLEAVNHQIELAAWSKIPLRLRPPGR
jgi:hypothetical protein